VTLAGIIVFDLVGAVVTFWIIHAIRIGRLYVGYGVIFVALIALAAAVASIPPLGDWLRAGLHALYPSGDLIDIVVVVLFLMLIYVSYQLSRIAEKLATVVRELAIERERVDRGAPDESPR